MPLPNARAAGTLPLIAVMGAAVATAMKTTPMKPTEFGWSLSTRWVELLPDTCPPRPLAIGLRQRSGGGGTPVNTRSVRQRRPGATTCTAGYSHVHDLAAATRHRR